MRRAWLLPLLWLALLGSACGQTLSGGWVASGGFTLSPASGGGASGLSALEFGQDMNIRTHPWPNAGHDVEFGVFRLWDSNSTKWNAICPSTCTWTELDGWLDWIEAHGGKKVIYTFGYNSSNPTFPTNWTTWDNFATAIAQHSAARKAAGHQGIDYYELWNEPNNAYWNSGAGVSVVNLVSGMQHAYPKLKQYDPTAQVMSPSACYCLQAPQTYTASYLAEAQSRNDPNYPFFDIQAYHSYLGTYSTTIKPEGVTGSINSMKSTMATYGISALPLWNTEFSWEHTGSATVGATAGADATYQTNFVARAHAMYIASGVRVTWYGWDFAGESWGTMWDATNGVHPAGYAYDRIIHWLTGATSIQALSTTNLGGSPTNYRYVLGFINANGKAAELVWDKTADSTYTVPAGFQGTTYTRIDGTTGTAGATLTVGEAMIYLQVP